MTKWYGPMMGLAIGVSLIYFRKNVAWFLERLFEVMPQYKEGVKIVGFVYKARPIFIVLFGVTIIFFALIGLIMMLNEN